MPENKTTLGFWVYLMTDCVVFACLFAIFAVLRNNTYDGPSGAMIFNLRYVLIETMLLLTSSFTVGLAYLEANRQLLKRFYGWLAMTFILGASFLAMELVEFNHLISEGNSWRKSGFLSSYFTLVGTHGLHITIGLIWLIVLAVKIFRTGLVKNNLRRLALFGLFWHFLDVIWIFIFTFIYLIGVARP